MEPQRKSVRRPTRAGNGHTGTGPSFQHRVFTHINTVKEVLASFEFVSAVRFVLPGLERVRSTCGVRDPVQACSQHRYLQEEEKEEKHGDTAFGRMAAEVKRAKEPPPTMALRPHV